MDMNEYLVDRLVHIRMSEMHEAAARRSLVSSARRRTGVRVTLGLALIRLGRWALGPARRPLASHSS